MSQNTTPPHHMPAGIYPPTPPPQMRVDMSPMAQGPGQMQAMPPNPGMMQPQPMYTDPDFSQLSPDDKFQYVCARLARVESYLNTILTQLGVPNPNQPVAVMGGPMPNQFRTNGPAGAGGDKRKTALCRHFSKGYCSMGDSCNFAHGVADLSPSQPRAIVPVPTTPPNNLPDQEA
eukprot:NODE_942_length_1105_cov_39.691207_g898_i0.p2 GENE.NODE_942_length_1105_cov_39.691207_g898_i0~~NODE_942_length_1105_cov_39.691207_g898_i0.p2  ORF type:complete len:195 (-),score=38.69 NODE_942_length_1105_cov_39.691207_g898_i0:520-1044(-)